MRPSAAAEAVPVTVIRPTPGWHLPRFRHAWNRRELLVFFAVRDLKVRYAQTLLGAFWTIGQPLTMMAVFTLVFGRIARVDASGLPYPIFALAGLIYWSFFSRSLLQGAESLVSNSALVTKTSAPRLLIPLSAIASGLFDLTVSLAFFFVFAAIYGIVPGWELLALPAVLVLGVVLVAGPVLLLSALNVFYRDVRSVLPFVVLIGIFLSPIAYSIDQLGSPWASLAAINPLVGAIEAFRWSLTGTAPPGALELVASLVVTGVLLLVGLLYFGRTERTLADRV